MSESRQVSLRDFMEAFRKAFPDSYKELRSDEIKSSFCRCHECSHSFVSAVHEHADGDVTNYYMCDYWHRPTDADGFCHKMEPKGWSHG